MFNNTNSLVSELMVGSKQPAPVVPVVGMGATICLWTDRIATTIVMVSKSGKTITVQHDAAKRIIGPNDVVMSESQHYEYSTDVNARTEIYSLRKNGRWIRKGESLHGAALVIGVREHYHDFDF